MNRRGFFRVALLGSAGVAGLAACPQFLQSLCSKTYFFLNGNRFAEWYTKEALRIMENNFILGELLRAELDKAGTKYRLVFSLAQRDKVPIRVVGMPGYLIPV